MQQDAIAAATTIYSDFTNFSAVCAAPAGKLNNSSTMLAHDPRINRC